jgi:hypothetical protein
MHRTNKTDKTDRTNKADGTRDANAWDTECNA